MPRGDDHLKRSLAEITEVTRAAADGDRASAERLLAALQAAKPLIREAAARGIGKVAHATEGIWPGGPEAGAQVVDRVLQAMAEAHSGGARSDPGCRVRTECVVALGELRPAASVAEAALRRAISTVQMEMVGGAPEDTAVALRGISALVMAQLRCDCLTDLALLLFEGLPDPVTHVDPLRAAREGAARALAVLGDPAGAALLAIRLRQPGESGEVLAACIDALCALGPPRTAEWITPLLQSADPGAMVAAASALCALCPDAAVPALTMRIASAPEGAAAALCFALGSARSPQTGPALHRLTEDRRPAVRAAAVQTLRMLG